MKKEVACSFIIFLVTLIPFSFAKEINIPNVKEGETQQITTEETNYYALLGEEVIAKVNNGEVEYLHKDRIGSSIVSSNGNIERSKTLPFGEEINNDGITYSFTGKELDSNNLYYFGARYYNPDSGRFLSADPIRENINPYVYTDNNPLAYVDPTGNSLVSANGNLRNYLANARDYFSRSNIPLFNTLIANLLPQHKEEEINKEEPITIQESKPFSDFVSTYPKRDKNTLDIEICDVLQCADLAYYLWGSYNVEYLNQDVSFRLSKGEEVTWSKWKQNPKSSDFGQDFSGFMRYVFTYASSITLKRDLEEVYDVNEIQPGDVIISRMENTPQGYHVYVVYQTESINNQLRYKLIEGNTPAVDITIRSVSWPQEKIKEWIEKGDIVGIRRFSNGEDFTLNE